MQVADLREARWGRTGPAKANYAIYESARKSSADEKLRIRIDLGRPYPIDSVKLYPVVFDSWDHSAPDFGTIPDRNVRSDDGSRQVVTIADHTGSDYEAAAVDQDRRLPPGAPWSAGTSS